MGELKKYKVTIGFMTTQEIFAEDKEEAEEIAWFNYDQDPPDIEIDVKPIKD